MLLINNPQMKGGAIKVAQLKRLEKDGRSISDIKQMQKEMPGVELLTWMENGTKLHEDNIWCHRAKTVVSECLLPYLTTKIHYFGHDDLQVQSGMV